MTKKTKWLFLEKNKVAVFLEHGVVLCHSSYSIGLAALYLLMDNV